LKKLLVLTVGLIVLAASPVFSDWRVDLGLDLAFAAGAFGGGESEMGGFEGGVLPIPMGEGSYVFDVGPLGIGIGIRGVPLIMIIPFWPDVFAELDLRKAALEAHIGGLVFGYIGLANGVETGKVLIPEVSGWLKLGKKERFRVGVGAAGAWVPGADIGDDNTGISVWLFFAGCKWVIGPG
jgi:hypothetical protein